MTTISDSRLMADAERNLAELAAQNAKYKLQLRQLRNRLRPGRSHRVIEQARQDARTILHHRHAGLPTSRRDLAALGLVSEYKFSWAFGLLSMCGLRSFTPTTLAELDAAIRRLDARADGLQALAPELAMQRMRSAAGSKYAKQTGRYRSPGR